MKRLRDLFRREGPKEQKPEPRVADFFCLYCNAKFSQEDLPRVIAHLKPHASKDEAEARLQENGTQASTGV